MWHPSTARLVLRHASGVANRRRSTTRSPRRSVPAWRRAGFIHAAALSRRPPWPACPALAAAAGDPAGQPCRAGWTYDSAVDAPRRSPATGALDARGAMLAQLRSCSAPDGALAQSYDLRGGQGDGCLRSGAIAWVGLAAIELRAVTCSSRNDALLDGVAALAARAAARAGTASSRGGPDVRWMSTEHNLEARALFAGSPRDRGRPVDAGAGALRAGLDGRPQCRALAPPARGGRTLDARSTRPARPRRRRHAHFRQGFETTPPARRAGARHPAGSSGRAAARTRSRVAAYADATMLVHRPPLVGTAALHRLPAVRRRLGPDVLWMEGTLQMRPRKARSARHRPDRRQHDALGGADRPGMLLQADRAAGEDYHAWPAAAPAAWLR